MPSEREQVGWMQGDIGEVAKRSNAADCKSVAPAASEVRILPSPPDLLRGAAPLGLPYAVTRAAWGPRSVPAGAPLARLTLVSGT